MLQIESSSTGDSTAAADSGDKVGNQRNQSNIQPCKSLDTEQVKKVLDAVNEYIGDKINDSGLI